VSWRRRSASAKSVARRRLPPYTAEKALNRLTRRRSLRGSRVSNRTTWINQPFGPTRRDSRSRDRGPATQQWGEENALVDLVHGCSGSRVAQRCLREFVTERRRRAGRQPDAARPTADAGSQPGADASGQVPTDASIAGPDASNPSGPASWHWENPLPQGNELNAVWGSGASDAWTVGRIGTVLHWDGAIWSKVPSGTTNVLNGVWGSAPNDVWAVGWGGLIVHWNGSVWTSVSSDTALDLYGIWGSAANDVWAVGDGSHSSLERLPRGAQQLARTPYAIFGEAVRTMCGR